MEKSVAANRPPTPEAMARQRRGCQRPSQVQRRCHLHHDPWSSGRCEARQQCRARQLCSRLHQLRLLRGERRRLRQGVVDKQKSQGPPWDARLGACASASPTRRAACLGCRLLNFGRECLRSVPSTVVSFVAARLQSHPVVSRLPHPLSVEDDGGSRDITTHNLGNHLPQLPSCMYMYMYKHLACVESAAQFQRCTSVSTLRVCHIRTTSVPGTHL